MDGAVRPAISVSMAGCDSSKPAFRPEAHTKRPYCRPPGVVRVLHVLGLAVDADPLQPFEALEHSLSVDG